MDTEFVRGEKYLWQMPTVDQQAITRVAAKYNISFPIAQALLNRGYTTDEQLDSFLFSTFEKDVAHASQMKDADKTVDRILHAIEHQEKILIFGDYDVDGITSSAMMMICLLPLGAKVNFFLPHRVKDGYGLSVKAVNRAADNDYKVIITVDNGITAFAPADTAKERGVDLIITDHHRPHGTVPDAFAIVNPNQQDCTYPFKVLAGVGVTFKILSLLYERKGLPMLSKAYELLLLGTVADVVPLVGENRFWVRYGLQYINSIESRSLQVLKENGKVTKSRMSSLDIGFSIAPQINALGRLQDPRQGVGFLIGTDLAQVQETGKILLSLNQARREIERSIVAQVQAEIEQKRIDLAKENVIIAASSPWQPGVIGLVASRLVSAYGRPALLFHLTDKGLAKGSCRSIPAFNMFDALQQCSDLLEQFGGHSMAAGLSLKIDNLPKLKERLEQLVAEQLTPFDLIQKLTIDGQMDLPDLGKKFMADLVHMEPFGNANPQPVFQVNNVVLMKKPTLLKDAHVKCSLFADGVIKPIIFFNRPELFDILMQQGTDSFDVAAQAQENHWQGRVSIELVGVDVAFNKE